MRANGYWGTNLELLAFSDLMRLNINIKTSLDQDAPEFKIDHPQNMVQKISSLNHGDTMKLNNLMIKMMI